MRDIFKILAAGLVLIGSVPLSTARAATAAPQVTLAQAVGPTRVLSRAQTPSKAETCKAKWPYVVLICVA